jgi:CheY-like chemotaxis protein
MMGKNYFYRMLIVVPLLVLLALGGYFGYVSWKAYQEDSILEKRLRHVKLLQSLEHSFFNELVCFSTLLDSKSQTGVCGKITQTTDNFISAIEKDHFNSELYALKNNIAGLRIKIAESKETVIPLIVNGDIEKNVHQYIQRYIEKTQQSFTTSTDRENLGLYKELNQVAYASEIEKAFIAYYLARREPISPEYLIFWDKAIALQALSPEKYAKYPLYRNLIAAKWQSEETQSLLRKIENIRFDVMVHANNGNYKSKLIDWIKLSNQKHTILMRLEESVIDKTLLYIQARKNQKFLEALFATGMAILSLLALLLLFKMFRTMNKETRYFSQLIEKVKNLNNAKTETFSNKELAYSFIEGSYESLYIENEKLKEENRKKSRFFNTLFYKVQKPLGMILGYVPLMQETPLTTEQKEYLNSIDEGAKALNTLIKHSPLELEQGEKVVVTNGEKTFDLIRKTEASVEVFTQAAAQKDINLTLFTDPTLAYQVIGDDVKIYEVVNSLIDHAMENTHTYGDIDVTLEKTFEEKQSVVVKFSVSNSSVGMDSVEIDALKKRLNNKYESIHSVNIKEEILAISDAILRNMGSKLEIESIKGESVTFAFTLRLRKADQQEETFPSVRFEQMKIGIALPSLDIYRKREKNIEAYINAFGAECQFYDYNSLINRKTDFPLPELMIVYHRYARLEGELEMLMGLECNIALVTTPTLRSRIDLTRYHFSSIIYEPVTYHKVMRMLAESKLGHTVLSIDNAIKKEHEAQQKEERLKGLRILLAEDNKINQQLWKERLLPMGIDVFVADNGKEAFEKRRENDFDMILMDIEMPVMDGVEATNKILYFERVNQLQHVPIIGLVNDQTEGEKYVRLGMDAVYVKSSSDTTLKQLIEKYAIDLALQRIEEDEDALIAKIFADDDLI